MLEELKEKVCTANLMLPKYDPVSYTHLEKAFDYATGKYGDFKVAFQFD